MIKYIDPTTVAIVYFKSAIELNLQSNLTKINK